MSFLSYLLRPLKKYKNDVRELKNIYTIILFLHAAFLAICAFLFVLELFDVQIFDLNRFANYLSILGAVQILVNLVLISSSLRNEANSQGAYKAAVSTRGAVLHAYEEFIEHVRWINSELAPAKWTAFDKLQIFVSTPVYGLANRDDFSSCDLFLEFLQEWVGHIKNLANLTDKDDRPIVEFCCWSGDKNRQFCAAWIRPLPSSVVAEDVKVRMRKFAQLMQDLYACSENSKIRLRLYFSDETQTRWFTIKESTKQAGLGVIFTPLTLSAIQHNSWRLLGISYSDKTSFDAIKEFTERLHYIDHSKTEKEDQTHVLVNATSWISDHYGVNF